MKRNPMMNNPQDTGGSSITKNLTTRSSSWRSYFFFPLVALFLGLLMLSADTSFASHGRGGSITWTPTGNAREVQITSRQGWRADAFGPVPSVGATMSNDYFDFGDASGFYPTYTVTAVNVAENWMEITSVFTHTYTTDGNYTVVSQNSCCRISNLSGGNADAYYKIQTEISINSASQNKAPISSMPIILYVNPGVTTNYVIPATDPDGDPLTYSFASNTETNLVANPGSTSISLSGSTLTVDAAVLGANTLWAVAVKVADNKGAYINLDFIISVSGTASAPPAFDYGVTPANGFVYNVGVGTPINFSLKADDPDVADVVNISVTGSPIGSVFTPTSGNPGTATFSFTPAASGSYVVLFSASDGASSVGTSVIINVGAVASSPFITKWIPSSGHIKIPTSGGGYNYNIDVIHVLTNTSIESASSVSGSYTTSAVLNPADEYLVKISEAVPGSGFPYFYSLGLNAGERADLKEIVQWGTIHWSSMTSSFRNLPNMDVTATDVPDLSGVSDLSYMFLSSIGMTGSTANWAWNTATITNMKSVFNDAQAFNGDVSSWNTASVSNMNSMFRGAGQFNYNIGGWNTSSVTDMGQMFQNANSFDQNIGSWNLSNLTNASAMFNAAPGKGMGCANMGLTLTGWANAGTASNITIGVWNREVPNDVWNLLGVPYLKTIKNWTFDHELTVTTCQGSYFITKWQPTSGYIKIPASNWTGPYNYSVTIFDLTTLLPAFSAPVVNGTYTSPPLNPVNQYYALVSENVSGGFPHFNALGLNSGEASDILEIVQWGPNHWKTMVSAFRALPNLDLTATDAPDLSNVTDLNFMFLNSKGLTGTLGNWVWNTSNVTTMKGTFNDAQKFNGDLSEWNTSNVTDMNSMFRGAGLFNYDISDWNTSNVTTMKQMFQNAHSFNQNLEDWDLSSLTDAAFMFNANPGQGMDCDNLTNTLIGWGANASTPNGVTLGAKNRYYTSGADAGLLAKSWTITDASGTCTPAPLVPVVAKMDNVAFGAYPNPSNGIVNVTTGAMMGESYIVTDMYGRQIINGKINSAVTTIDLSNYAKGLYVIRVADKAVKVTIK